MDEITVCAAVIGLDEGEQVIVSACDDGFLHLMGATGAESLPFPMPLAALLHANSALQVLQAPLRACFAPETSQTPSHQTVDLRQEALWWRFSLKPIPAGASGMRQVMLTGVDMAAKARLREDAEANASRYRTLVDLAYDAIVIMNSQHRITFFNRAAESLFGYASSEVLGQPIVTLMPESYRASHPQKVQRFSEAYQPKMRQETPPKMDGSNSVYGRHRDGSIIPVEIAVSKTDLNGEVEFMAIVRDIRDRAKLMEFLKRQAATDALTGLPNRREFIHFVQEKLQAPEGVSVFILDVDFFKKINDRYGHDVGDEVLCVLAKVALSMLDGQGMFARWGGEEFVAAFPGARIDFAHKIADELRQRYEWQAFEYVWRVKPIPFTVSIGVAQSGASDLDVDTLMKRADRALYQAKSSGRNRVEQG